MHKSLWVQHLQALAARERAERLHPNEVERVLLHSELPPEGDVNIASDLKALPGLATDAFNAASPAPPLAGDANPAAPTVSEELP